MYPTTGRQMIILLNVPSIYNVRYLVLNKKWNTSSIVSLALIVPYKL